MDHGSSSSSSHTTRPPRIIKQVRRLNDSLFELYKPIGPASMQILFFSGFQPAEYKNAHLSTWRSGYGSCVWPQTWLAEEYPDYAHLSTWRSGDGSCLWPQTWLAEEYPDAHIISVSYGGLKKSQKGEEMDMFKIGENVMYDVLGENIGQDVSCPVVLVGHSFGGLVMKQLCVHPKNEASKCAHTNFLANVKGCFFYATPHGGVPSEKLAAEFVTHEALLEFVKISSKSRSRLNYHFDDFVRNMPWMIAGVGECLPIKRGEREDSVFVPEASARYGDNFRIITDANHFSICRPMEKTSSSFKELTKHLQRISEITSAPLIGVRTTQELADASSSAALEYNATHEALEKRIAYTPASFDFGHNGRYVEIPGSIQEVRDALDDVEGLSAVTVYGEAGIGKSQLVMSTGLLYEQEKGQLARQMDSDKAPSFRDGVQYLYCGKGAKVREVQLKLLEKLGIPSASATAGVQEGPSQQSVYERNKRELRNHLEGKELLIIFDDLWDPDVLQGVFVESAKGVKYLISSQDKEIWSGAKRIRLRIPEKAEARQLLANYIDGHTKESNFPEEVQPIVDEIIETLGYHPLSLANVGVSILREKADDAEYWRSKRDDLFHSLGSLNYKPRGYGLEPYRLTVGSSMMLMVEHLLEGKRPVLPLLDLMALLESPVPESVVKWFYQSIQPAAPNHSFETELKELVDKSIIELRMEGNDCTLAMHGLRIHFIQEARRSAAFAMAVSIIYSKKEYLIRPISDYLNDHLLDIRDYYMLKLFYYLVNHRSSLLSSSFGTWGSYLSVRLILLSNITIRSHFRFQFVLAPTSIKIVIGAYYTVLLFFCIALSASDNYVSKVASIVCWPIVLPGVITLGLAIPTTLDLIVVLFTNGPNTGTILATPELAPELAELDSAGPCFMCALRRSMCETLPGPHPQLLACQRRGDIAVVAHEMRVRAKKFVLLLLLPCYAISFLIPWGPSGTVACLSLDMINLAFTESLSVLEEEGMALFVQSAICTIKRGTSNMTPAGPHLESLTLSPTNTPRPDVEGDVRHSISNRMPQLDLEQLNTAGLSYEISNMTPAGLDLESQTLIPMNTPGPDVEGDVRHWISNRMPQLDLKQLNTARGLSVGILLLKTVGRSGIIYWLYMMGIEASRAMILFSPFWGGLLLYVAILDFGTNTSNLRRCTDLWREYCHSRRLAL